MTAGSLRSCCLLLPLLFCRSAATTDAANGQHLADSEGEDGGSQPPSAAAAWQPPPLQPASSSPQPRQLFFFPNLTPAGQPIPGLAKNSQCCGIENDDSRILGGLPTQKNQYPWMAAIYLIDTTSKIICGGSLVNDRYVVTSAYCMNSFARTALKTKTTKSGEKYGPTFAVILGRHKQDENSGNDLMVDVANVIIHPGFSPTGPGPAYNDIALVKLQTPLNLPIQGNLIAPICMPSRGTYSNTEAVMAGWGSVQAVGPADVVVPRSLTARMRPSGRTAGGAPDSGSPNPDQQPPARTGTDPVALPDRLHSVQLRTLSNSRCNRIVDLSDIGFFAVQDTQICAAGEDVGAGNRGFCDIDSGGPLMVSPWYLKTRRSLVGVATVSNPCDEVNVLPRVGIYTRVTSYLDWLIDNMPDAKYC